MTDTPKAEAKWVDVRDQIPHRMQRIVAWDDWTKEPKIRVVQWREDSNIPYLEEPDGSEWSFRWWIGVPREPVTLG